MSIPSKPDQVHAGTTALKHDLEDYQEDPAEENCTGFWAFKSLLYIIQIVSLVLTIISIPWCYEFTLEVYSQELAQTGHDDSWIYPTVTVAITVTILIIIYGLFALYDESFSKSLFFSFLCFILAGTSLRYVQFDYVLASSICEFVAGLLFVIFAFWARIRKSRKCSKVSGMGKFVYLI